MAGKRKPQLKTFHATVRVTRVEEWCVEAVTAQQAKALLTAGQGHRCTGGDRLHVEVEAMLDESA